MNFRDFISINKWRILIGYTYVSVFAIGIVVCKTIQDIFKPYFFFPIWVLLPLAVIGLWVLGFCADKYGFYSAESKYMTERNDFFAEMRGEMNAKKKE